MKYPIKLHNVKELCEGGNLHIQIGMSDMNDREDSIDVVLWLGDDTDRSFRTNAQMHPDADLMECLRIVISQMVQIKRKQ